MKLLKIREITTTLEEKIISLTRLNDFYNYFKVNMKYIIGYLTIKLL